MDADLFNDDTLRRCNSRLGGKCTLYKLLRLRRIYTYPGGVVVGIKSISTDVPMLLQLHVQVPVHPICMFAVEAKWPIKQYMRLNC